MCRGYIYKLYSPLNVGSGCYIGSTSQVLKKRLACHKCAYKRYTLGKRNYYSAFDILKNEDVVIELVEELDYNEKQQLKVRERYWIDSTLNCVNIEVPSRSKSEYDKWYHQANLEHRKKLKKEYYQSNKEKIKSRVSKIFQCECGSNCIWGEKSRHFKTKKHQAWLESQKETNN